MSYRKRHTQHNKVFKISGLRVEVKHDNFDRALKKFSRKVQDAGVVKEVKERQHYEKPSAKKQRDKKQAKKRWLKKLNKMKPNKR